jgi:hypothetical protein
MRLVWLYARSRGVLVGLVLIVAICLGFALLQNWASVSARHQASVLQAIPALAASVIGIGAWSPFGEPERTAAWPLARLRAGHAVVLLAVTIGVTSLTLADWSSLVPDLGLGQVAVRNLVGLTGAALLLGRVVDARLSWLAPFTITAAMAARLLVAAPERLWSHPWWAWTGQDQSDRTSWLLALLLAAAGFGAYLRHGPRDIPGEAE